MYLEKLKRLIIWNEGVEVWMRAVSTQKVTGPYHLTRTIAMKIIGKSKIVRSELRFGQSWGASKPFVSIRFNRTGG